MSMRAYFSVLFSGFRYIIRSAGVTAKGQGSSYAVIQQAHKLEKGLSIREPRRLWGYANAGKLVDFIAAEEAKPEKDSFALQIGKAVLSAYLLHKEKQEDAEERKKTEELKRCIAEKLGRFDSDASFGGTLSLTRDEVKADASAAADLFATRHSVRDFDDTPVDSGKLEKAVGMALRAPSACNRQPTQIYVISGDDRARIGNGNDYHADKYLILTGDMKAFSLSELNDWIVSTSVFAAYLTLALHAEGIGSCIFRKDIIRKSRYNDAVRKLCGIPDHEQIILEIAIGNYKDSFNVPVSRRREAKEILHVIQ